MGIPGRFKCPASAIPPAAQNLVPHEGFEPPRPKALVSKTNASASSASRAQKIW